MYLHALTTAVPEFAFTQEQCWERFHASPAARRLKPRSAEIIEKVLCGDSGINKRHFALGELDRLFESTAEELNLAFEKEAPALAATALSRAMKQSGWTPDSIDALVVCTCTGYLCPGITSHVSEQLGLRPDAFLQDLVGLGCGAAIPSLRAATGLAAAHPEARIAIVAVEICSAAFYLEDDPGVLISACIFSDGAAAALCSGTPGPGALRFSGFDTVHIPEDREFLRFLNSGGKLKNRLHRSVPQRAARAVKRLWDNQAPLAGAKPPAMIPHSGGRDVLDELERHFPRQNLGVAREVLRHYGNMSSPSVLFALEAKLREKPPGPLWLVSFGAGFSAHSCLLAPP